MCVQSVRKESRSLRRPPWAMCTSAHMVEGGEGREVRGGGEGWEGR